MATRTFRNIRVSGRAGDGERRRSAPASLDPVRAEPVEARAARASASQASPRSLEQRATTRNIRGPLALWRALIAALCCLAALPAAAQDFPKYAGFVTDAANVLPAATKDDLTRKLAQLKTDTGRQLVVATVPSLNDRPIEDYGYQLGRAWGIGLKGADNGAILLIAPNEHKLRIEAGYGLEPVLTDAWSGLIISQQMVPKLKANDLPGAVEAGADAIIAQLRLPNAEARKKAEAAAVDFDRAHPRRQPGHSGGGIPISLVLWGVVLLIMVLPMLSRRRRGWSGERWGGQQSWGGGGSNWPIILWGIANELGHESRRGGWSGGGGSWGGSSGGGSDSGSGWFSGDSGGGGGSFGGGGASGSW